MAPSQVADRSGENASAPPDFTTDRTPFCVRISFTISASAGEPKLWSETRLASLSSWAEVILSTSGVSSVGHCVMPGSYSPSQTGQIICTPFNFDLYLDMGSSEFSL